MGFFWVVFFGGFFYCQPWPDLLVYDGLELGLLCAGGGLVRRLLLGQGSGDHHQRVGGGGGGGGVASDGSRAVSPRGGAGALVAPAMQLVVPGISNLCSPRLTDKKGNKIFLIRKFRMEQLQSHILYD